MTDPICTCGHKATWHGEFRCFECEHCHLGETDVLRAALEKALEDTRRLDRMIHVLGLSVVRDEPGDWTCCLDFPQGIAYNRSQTTDVREFLDLFARFDAAPLPTTEDTP